MACRHLQIEVTSRCNLSCITCLYGHYPERRVEADRVDTLYAKIINAPQHLRSDMPVLVRRAREAGLRVSLNSNGSIMDESLARALIAAGRRSQVGPAPKNSDCL